MDSPVQDAVIDLGGCRARVIPGGRFRLDGGAMFGIIPKPMWSKRIAADADNHIGLACNCLLVEWEGSDRRVIIETGHGAKYDEKERGFFAIDPARWLLTALEERGIEASSITDVVLTHLHFDHAGGLTRIEGGQALATFPRAAVHVQAREMQDARANFGIMTNTYRSENYAAIDGLDAWRLANGDVELLSAGAGGISAMRTPGHTHGHQSIIVRGRDRELVFAGDVMPTRHHAGRPYNMAYDLLPLENRASKGRLLEYVQQRRAVLVLGHEPETPVLRVEREKDWFTVIPV